jgi:ATP-binding cassette subfamily B protein
MPFVEELPGNITELLARERGTSDNLQVAVSTDIAPDGDFGEQWLILNHADLLVVSQNADGAEVSTRIPVSQITAAKAESLIGIGVLEVQVDGHPTRVLQFSNGLRDKFGKVAKRIEAIAKKEELPDEELEDQRKRCEKCGRLLDNLSNVCPGCISRRRVLTRLIRHALPYKGVIISTSLLTLIGAGLEMIPPYFTKPLIDDVLFPASKGGNLAHQIRLLGLLVLALIAIRVTATSLVMFRGRAAARLGSTVVLDIRNKLYESLQMMSLSFFDKRQVGAVMTRVSQDTQQIYGFLVEGAQYYIINVIMVIGIAIVLLCLNWKLGLLVLLPAPLLVVITLVSWRRLMRTFHHFWHSMSKLGAVLNDSLSGIKVVKAFGQENVEIDRFNLRSGQLYEAGLRAEQMIAVIFPILGFTMVAGSLLVWWVGGKDVIFGNITLGTLMTFLAYIGMFYGPLQILTRITDWMSRSLTAAERIFEVMDTMPDVQDDPESVPVPHIKGDIEFQGVTFGYDKHQPVLKEVDFAVKAGEMIGLVGHSGSGKTTTVNLVCRFYDPNEGAITLDGIDLRKVKLSDLRRQIGVVLQDPFLFNGTVAENIAYGKPDATREEIMAAAKAANAHEFIMKFPDGYDTLVRERGQRLSAGERQRISIARAILRNPRILILDEATSSVDVETEKQLQEATGNLVKDRTTFAIAHRLSTLRNADRLLVLENGKFVEFGSHEELLKKKGVYYKLVNLQKEVSKIKAVDG